ncbi:hypothetical protein S40293_09404 [Stachybotrys chartarum IBT 40293]|nr:hypothetical protein S40293_09404 [Stachybotrys chartarum IBT 40293]
MLEAQKVPQPKAVGNATTQTAQALESADESMADITRPRAERLTELVRRVSSTIEFCEFRADATIIASSSKRNDESKSAEIYACKVSSASLYNTSKYWKVMLGGHFAEAQPGQSIILDMTEDKFEALEIFLNIIHLHFDKVPCSLSVENFAELAKLADKYLSVALLRPWVNVWAKPILGTEFNAADSVHLLWISFIFGLEDIFDSLCVELCQVGAKLTEPVPPGVEDILEGRKQDMLNCMLSKYYEPVNFLTSLVEQNLEISVSKRELTHVCRNNDLDCVMAQLGSIIGPLMAHDLWPMKEAKDITTSPEVLLQSLIAIRPLPSCIYSYLEEIMEDVRCGQQTSGLQLVCGMTHEHLKTWPAWKTPPGLKNSSR